MNQPEGGNFKSYIFYLKRLFINLNVVNFLNLPILKKDFDSVTFWLKIKYLERIVNVLVLWWYETW